MLTRIRLATLLLLAAGCSQRAAWRVVPEPAAVPVTPQASATSSGDVAVAPALATAAPAELDALMTSHLSQLLFPVPAVDSTRLDDSFSDARDGGARRHAAIDIMAPRGTPVLSVDDGRIVRLSNNPKGGTSLYATDLDHVLVYYYAHFDRYYPGLYDGKPIARGDTIGYVGTTGNAPENVPHLHLQIMRMTPGRKYWDGEPIDPYPFLKRTVTAASP